MSPEISEVFNRKLIKLDPSACWPWPTLDTSGYGTFWSCGKRQRAHRVSYEQHHGEIPQGLLIDHICRNRACVNPAHLRAVTPRVNVHENSVSIAHLNSLKTHCIHGHAFEGDNLDLRRGFRECRECKTIRAKRRSRSKNLDSARTKKPMNVSGRHKDKCKNGHHLSGGNLVIRANGHRECRECNKKSYREYRQRIKERLHV